MKPVPQGKPYQPKWVKMSRCRYCRADARPSLTSLTEHEHVEGPEDFHTCGICEAKRDAYTRSLSPAEPDAPDFDDDPWNERAERQAAMKSERF